MNWFLIADFTVEPVRNIKKGNEKKPIYIGIKMIADDEIAVKMHIPMTKNAGATRDEAKTTVLSGWSVIGTKSESKYLPLVLESYDENRQI